MKSKGSKKYLTTADVVKLIVIGWAIILIIVVMSSCESREQRLSRSQSTAQTTMSIHDGVVATLAIDSIKANIFMVEIDAYDGDELVYSSVEYVISRAQAESAIRLRSNGVSEYNKVDSIKTAIVPIQILEYSKQLNGNSMPFYE